MIFLSAHRNGDLENGAAIPVVGADRTFMQVDDLLRQGKADAGFSAFAHVKAVEDVGQISLGNAIPIVLYPDYHIPFVGSAGQTQLTAGISQVLSMITPRTASIL